MANRETSRLAPDPNSSGMTFSNYHSDPNVLSIPNSNSRDRRDSNITSTSISTSINHEGYEFSYLKIIFVIVLFIISMITFVSQTELTSLLFTNYGFDEPILLLYLNHGSWWALWVVQFVSIALLKSFKRYLNHIKGYDELNGKRWKGFRKAFASSVKAQHQNIFHTAELTTKANNPNYQIIYNDSTKSFKNYSTFFKSEALLYMIKMSVLLSIILNVAGVTWFIAMGLSTGSDVTAIYNCSAFTAYVFAIPILKEKFSWIKANSVITAVAGVFVVAYMGSSNQSNDANNYPYRLMGNLIILVGAILYGLYEVFYKKWCCPPSEIVSARRQATFSNFVMCLMGISTFFLLGIGMLTVHFSGLHHFKIPTNSKAILCIVLSLISNHLFSVSFLGLMSLTSPVLSSVASLLTILVVGVFEWTFRGIIITFAQLFGYLLIIIGFSLLSYASWNEISKEDVDDGYITDAESTYSASLA